MSCFDLVTAEVLGFKLLKEVRSGLCAEALCYLGYRDHRLWLPIIELAIKVRNTLASELLVMLWYVLQPDSRTVLREKLLVFR